MDGWSRDPTLVEACENADCLLLLAIRFSLKIFVRPIPWTSLFFLARAPPSVITDAWSQCWVTLLGQTLPALQHHRLLPANVLGRSGPVGEHNNSRVVSADISIRGTA